MRGAISAHQDGADRYDAAMTTAAPTIKEASGQRTGPILGGVFAATLLVSLLPDIALDTAFADLVVRLSGTASWALMTPICVVLVALIVSRPGIDGRRRMIEGGALIATMVIALAGNALLNEHVVKPAFGIARPNIVELTESGALGPDYPNAEAFYSVGSKGDRRVVLGELLPTVTTVSLSPTVQAHWIHETGYSFPSGHATAAMTLVAMLVPFGIRWLSGWRRSLTVLVIPVWAVAIAYTRDLLQVHTPIDIIVGTLAGFGWGLFAFLFIQRTVTTRAG